MSKYQRITDDVKQLRRGAQPPPGMTRAELDAMAYEVDKERDLLRLSDEQVLALNLDAANDWELVVVAERFEAMGRRDLWLEALKRVCRSREHNVMIWYGDVYVDVVGELRHLGDYDQAIYYQRLAMEEDEAYCDGMNAITNRRELAQLCVEKGDLEEGLAVFREVVRRDPRDVWNYNALAITFPEAGFPELGVLAAKKGLEIARATKDPEDLLGQLQDILMEAERCISSGSKQIAPETYEKWLELLRSPLPPLP